MIYKGKVRRTWRTTVFIHVNISVRRYFSSFGCTPSSGMNAAQSFIHKALGFQDYDVHDYHEFPYANGLIITVQIKQV